MDELARQWAKDSMSQWSLSSHPSHNQWMDAAVTHQKANYPNMELIRRSGLNANNVDMAYNKAG